MSHLFSRIDPKRTAMIVVDMQNDFVANGAALQSRQAHDMVPRLAETLKFCREQGMPVIYTAHVHRRGGCDMGRFRDLYPPIANSASLVDDTDGADIYPDLKPQAGEIVVKKHRYSGFFGTDLNIILQGYGVDSVVVTGTTTENCCHATARDAMFHNYRVAFLSDATGTFDYPDMGYGAMSAEDVHRATLRILAFSTAHVMTAAEFKDLVVKGGSQAKAA